MLYTIAESAKRFLIIIFLSEPVNFFKLLAKIREKNCLAIKRIWSFLGFLKIFEEQKCVFLAIGSSKLVGGFELMASKLIRLRSS